MRFHYYLYLLGIGAMGIYVAPVYAGPHEDELFTAAATFILALTVTHAPLFLRWKTPSIYVRGIDYVWVGLSVLSAAFAYMGYQAARYEREHAAAIQTASGLLDSIEAQLVRVESVCTAMEWSLIRRKADELPYTVEDCHAQRWLAHIIAGKKAHPQFPLLESRGGQDGWPSSFQSFVGVPPEHIHHLEKSMHWPLTQQMQRFNDVAYAGVYASIHVKEVDASIFRQPRWWLYFFVAAVAFRISKTSFEIAPDIREALRRIFPNIFIKPKTHEEFPSVYGNWVKWTRWAYAHLVLPHRRDSSRRRQVVPYARRR